MGAAPGFDPVAFHARFRPGALACADLTTGERLTYRDFSARAWIAARRVAKALKRKRGERVALLSRNSAMSAVLVVACERAGAVLAPLNWRLTAAELSGLIADAEPALLVAEAEFADAAREAIASAGLSIQVVSPESFAGPDAADLKMPELKPLRGNEGCIILYTSGTTGRPKGVVITRDNALWSSMNFAAVAVVGPRARLLCDAPMFHTVGLVAITRTALQQGGAVLMSDRFVPCTTLARMQDPELAVTHYFVVPQMVEALLREPGFATADLSRLTALFSGGGPLPASLVRSCVERGVKLVNGYGMSEVGSAVHMPLDGGYMARNSHAVGFTAPYIEVRLANEDGEPVADGDVGEIWMTGPSVSPGYWRQPEATAATHRGVWFRSGDLGRYQEDGALVIVDRLKDMYISGGENVYPAEVEAVLRQVEGVIDAAVVGVADPRWGEVGAAFIETAKAHAAIGAAVRERCSKVLARYKQPAHLRFVEALPRTGSGKVLKQRLRDGFLHDQTHARSDTA